MTKSLEDRVAYLERFNGRLMEALGRHFHLAMAPDEEPADPPVPLDAMTKVQLADYAGSKGYDIGNASTKADMIAAIELRREEAARNDGQPSGQG